jgi:signal transduction histidine kinase
MKEHRIDDKIKPFRLVKYFTVTSLIVIFAGTVVLSILNTHWARAIQRQNAEDYALLILENLNHQVFTQFVLPVVLKHGEIRLRNKEQYEHLDKVVRNTLHSFKVEMVNIYDGNHIISYSFNRDLIGKKNLGGTGYQKAINGQKASRQVQRGNFWEILLGVPKESRLITFAPLRAERPLSRMSGPVLGVVEIVQDLSEAYQTIFRFQIFVVATSALVMLTLLLVLIFFVKRGEEIIERRALERLRLKDQLSRAEHLSSLGEMVAAVSHEIRNPLGIIRSSSELLKKKVSAVDPKNEIPDIIIEESSRLNNIITDFLNYARPRNPNLAPCRVEEVLDKNLTYLASQLEQQGYEINKSFNDNLPEIMADATMLYQAFLNILINSIQSMKPGGKIHIDLNSNHEAVIVSFEDEGVGIPVDLMEKIWDPFFTTKETGSGLGLGIVKKIIELHGGDIEIRNRSEGGARVLIILPLQQGGQ